MLNWTKWTYYGGDNYKLNTGLRSKGRKEAEYNDILFQIDNYNIINGFLLYIHNKNNIEVLPFNTIQECEDFCEELINK